MLKRSVYCLVIIIVAVTDSCIDPVDLDIKSSARKIVVDGAMTNEEGPHTIRLMYSQNAGRKSTDQIPLVNAIVSIYQDDDLVQQLTEREPGIYYTDEDWRGTIGRTYTLKFSTPSGENYESIPQALKHPGSQDSVYVRYHRDAILLNPEGTRRQDAIDVLIDARHAQGVPGPFRWKFTGMFHAATYPHLKVINTPAGSSPNPPECSGYINYFGELVRVGECTCCECWPVDFNNTISISEGQFTNQVYKDVLVTRVPATPLRFINRYYIEIEQFSLSEEVYTFWRLVKALQEAPGNIFQPNAIKVRGNMRAINSDEEVAGIFSVSGVVRKTLFVDSSVFPQQIDPEVVAEECLAVFPSAVTEKPAFWN
ncbi:MAG TPA: DUF4249 domain-containing protein [Chryseosolibacter sp.]